MTTKFQITKDKKVILNGHEILNCTNVSINLDAISSPEVVLTVDVDEVDIDSYNPFKCKAKED